MCFKTDYLVVRESGFGGFSFMGSLPSSPEGKDAIVAHISGKFRETPR